MKCRSFWCKVADAQIWKFSVRFVEITLAIEDG